MNITPTEEDPLLSVKRVANIFDVKEATVRGWIRDGKISATKLGGKAFRIQQSEVKRFANVKYGDGNA